MLVINKLFYTHCYWCCIIALVHRWIEIGKWCFVKIWAIGRWLWCIVQWKWVRWMYFLELRVLWHHRRRHRNVSRSQYQCLLFRVYLLYSSFPELNGIHWQILRWIYHLFDSASYVVVNYLAVKTEKKYFWFVIIFVLYWKMLMGCNFWFYSCTIHRKLFGVHSNLFTEKCAKCPNATAQRRICIVALFKL